MKKSLLLFVVLSIFNSSFSMKEDTPEVDKSVEDKFYSILSSNGDEVKCSESLAEQFKILKDRSEWCKDTSLSDLSDQVKLAGFLDYSRKNQLLDAVINSISQEGIEEILTNKFSWDLESSHEDILKERLVYTSRPLLMSHQLGSKKFSGHKYFVKSVCVTSNGKYVISGSADKTIKIWDIATGKCLKTLLGHESPVEAVCVSPDDGKIISGSFDGIVKIWNSETGYCLDTISIDDDNSTIDLICVTKDGSKIIIGHCYRGIIRIWNNTITECINTISNDRKLITSVCITPNSKCVISGFFNAVIKIWDIETGECLKILSGHEHSVGAVCVSPDGRMIMSGSTDRSIKIWDIKTGECLKTLSGHEYSVTSVCVPSDGRWIISRSVDGIVKIWDVERGKCLATLPAHKGCTTSACITPDGSKVVTGMYKAVKLLNLYNPDVEQILLDSPYKQAWMLHYVLKNPKAAQRFINNSPYCKKIVGQCDPKVQEIIRKLTNRSSIFSRKNTIIGAGFLCAGIGLYWSMVDC